jgi:hypothetical protein
VQRPFLRDSGDLARRLEPVAEEFERSLPPTSRAFRVGAPVLRRSPPFYRRTRETFRSLKDLAENPNTLFGLRDLRRTLEVLTPLVQWISPYQTVCNFWVYFWTGLSEHVSENVGVGGAQRSFGKSGNSTQDNRVNDSTADRPADVPFDQDPQTAKATEPGSPDLQALHGGANYPAIDSQGNADCIVGQRGYLNRLTTGGRYGPRENGGQHTVQDSDFPGLAGGTYKSRELGIDNVEDVP